MNYSENRIEKFLCDDGRERSLYIWEPENPAAVFLVVHGTLDHAGAYCTPALYFKQHGIASVALNQRGHDHRGPDHPSRVIVKHFDSLLDDIGLVLEKVKKDYPGIPVFFLAHSMGSLICTHFGIRRFEGDPEVKGFIFSSPYYVNAVRTPKVVRKMVGLIAAIVPRMKAPIEDIIEHLTRDREIYARHRQDQQDGVKATEISFRFGYELLKAQDWLPRHINKWKHPLLVIIAGTDKIADPDSTKKLIGKIDSQLVTELYYPENYHENFNEPNREEIYDLILKWVRQRASLPGH